MDCVESSLWRLHSSVSRFVVPSATLGDVRALRHQIELRRRALRDIEVIRCRLRLMHCEGSGSFRRLPGRHRNQSDLVFRAERVVRPALTL
jgi:hypothetical protein